MVRRPWRLFQHMTSPQQPLHPKSQIFVLEYSYNWKDLSHAEDTWQCNKSECKIYYSPYFSLTLLIFGVLVKDGDAHGIVSKFPILQPFSKPSPMHIIDYSIKVLSKEDQRRYWWSLT